METISETVHQRIQDDYLNGLSGPYAPAPVVMENRHIQALETLHELAQDGHFSVYFTRHWVKVSGPVFRHSVDPQTAEWADSGAWGLIGSVHVRCEDGFKSEKEFEEWRRQ